MSGRDDLKERCIEYLLEEHEQPIGLKWKKLISRVLQRIPYDLIARLYDISPRFLVLEKGSTASTKFVSDLTNTSTEDEVRTSKAWLIILNEAELEKLSMQDQMRTIAKELARVYLEHEALNNKLVAARTGKSKRDLSGEKGTARLIEQWGFNPK
jgi:hypothetical protein